jgi:multiple sugar transport system ATP-binding protein
MAKVVLDQVYKNYGGGDDAVKDASFTCEDGEFLVLLGPSGCGKTTTLRMITGLESITKGTIKIGDRLVNDLTPQQRNVAMAFETYALYPPLTVYQNIAFPLQVMKRSEKEIDVRVKEVAEALSITDILDKFPDGLAGGQKQRVSLARALVREPTVFLMDEPLSHVDSDVRYRARAEIKHIKAVASATIIYVTHDQIEAVALADRVIVMDQGLIQQIGTPADLYYRPANLFVAGFIGEPPMNLIHCRFEFAENMLQVTWHNNAGIAIQFSTSQISPAALKVLKAYHQQEVMVGVRPQKLALGPADSGHLDGTLNGKLLVHEFLGKEGIAQIEVDGTMLESVTPPQIPFNIGDTVSLSVMFEDLHFFELETTRRIEY